MHRVSSADDVCEVGYDGPSAPPVFVVLEGDIDSHELRSSGKATITKKLSEPLKRSIQLGTGIPKKGGNALRSSKKFFDEKDSPNPLRKIKRAMPHRRASSREDNSEHSPREGSPSSPSPLSNSMEIQRKDFDVDVDDVQSNEFIFDLEDSGTNHDIIINPEDHEGRDNSIGKKLTLMRKEARKKSGKAGTYLLHMPRTVTNGVEVKVNQTTQKLKDVVAADMIGPRMMSPRDDQIPANRVSRSESDRKRESKRKSSTILNENIIALAERQDVLEENVISCVTKKIETECNTLTKVITDVTESLLEQNEQLMHTINELTIQNKNTIVLLEDTTNRMNTLEERIIAVQKSQVNQITLFDFLFIILNFIIRIFSRIGSIGSSFVSHKNESKTSSKKPGSKPTISNIMNGDDVLQLDMGDDLLD